MSALRSLSISAFFLACAGLAACSESQDNAAPVLEPAAAPVIPTVIPCSTGGGECNALEACGRGAGALGSSKYSCGGSRRVCCFSTCGGKAEDFECCNADHTYAPRPLCQEGAFACPAGFANVPLNTCVTKPDAPPLPDEDAGAPPPVDAGATD
jgi:hypothetical protein